MKNVTVLISFFLIAFVSAQNGYKVGDEVKDFKLKNIDDKEVSLSSFSSAKGFIVVFTCNHCPFSIAYEQRIIDLDKKYAPLGFPVIAINPNDPEIVPEDSFEKMKERAKEKKYPFPYLWDETQQTAKDFGATRTPHVFIVVKEKNKFFLEYIGAIDNNTEDPDKADKKYVQEVVDAILSNNKTPYTETKAIGCTIKWKK